MKSLLFVCLMTVCAVPAFASKSRLNSLQGRLGLLDDQNLFVQPAYLNQLAPNATFEMGSSSVSGNPKAEGGAVADNNGARWGAYVGHTSAFQTLFRSVGTFQNTDNPVDVFYGKGNWAANLGVSNSVDNTTSAKQTTVTARGGMINGANEFAVSADLYATAEKAGTTTTDDFKSQVPMIQAQYLNRQADMIWAISAAYGSGKQNVSNVGSDMSILGASASFNRFLTDMIYWGAGLNYVDFTVVDSHNRTTTLPIFLGLEKDLASWVVVRASVEQSFLIATQQNGVAGTAYKNNLNDTKVAAGLGFKANGFLLDGSLAAASTGKLNGTDLLTQASLTYTF